MKIIIEAGSTCTKIDRFNGTKTERLENAVIEFKKNFKIKNELAENDVNTLISKVNKYKMMTDDIFVCGTSVFRNLTEEQRKEFLELFSMRTGLKFEIISQEKENEITVLGVTKNVKTKVAVMIGGGGSTEIALYDKGIKEIANSGFGVVDVTSKFPDFKENLATTPLSVVKNYIKESLNLPKQKADILILAGGAHKYFAEAAGFHYTKNTLYSDDMQPIMMDIQSRKNDTEKFFTETSLNKMKEKTDFDAGWWDATRAMVAFALVVAEALDVKYIVPTDMSLVHGIIKTG